MLRNAIGKGEDIKIQVLLEKVDPYKTPENLFTIAATEVLNAKTEEDCWPRKNILNALLNYHINDSNTQNEKLQTAEKWLDLQDESPYLAYATQAFSINQNNTPA